MYRSLLTTEWIPALDSLLTTDWIPTLDGVDERLQADVRVADVGCGRGVSTVAMGTAYPSSRFTGFDTHAPSVAAASHAAAEAGVGDRVAFEVADADALPPGEYDLIVLLDCLHDMGDPVGVARHLRDRLAEGGTLMPTDARKRRRPRAGGSAAPAPEMAAAVADAIPARVGPVRRPGRGRRTTRRRAWRHGSPRS